MNDDIGKSDSFCLALKIVSYIRNNQSATGSLLADHVSEWIQEYYDTQLELLGR